MPREKRYQAKSTTINMARAQQRGTRTVTEGVGKYSREMDIALPGKHTRICMMRSSGRKQAHWHSYEREWHALMDTYIILEPQNQTSVPADTQGSPSSTSSFDAQDGQHSEQNCCRKQTQERVTYPSTLGERHHLTLNVGHQI